MNLRQTVAKIFYAGSVVAVAFAWVPGEVRASQTKPSTAAPAKPAPAPAPAKAAPAQPTAGKPGQQPNGNRPAPPVPPKPPVHLPPSTGPTFPPTKREPTVKHVPPKPNEPFKYDPKPGDQMKPLPGGRQEFHDPKTNITVRTNPNGGVQRIEAFRGLAGGKMVVSRGPGGGRIVETGRPGARVVSYGAHRGFVERAIPNRPGYISRTYVVGGRSYAHVYRAYSYRGVSYYRYVPAVYYGPAFYGWALAPWGAPVAYGWGGGFAAPWFGFYAGYFTPYPTYASPDLWLTDYLIAQNLRLAYENQQAGNAGQAPPPTPNGQTADATLSPEMKALIADEVRQELAAERAAAMQPTSTSLQQPAQEGEQLQAALNQKFFVVSSNLDLATGSQACTLTPGDIIHRTGKDVAPDGGVAVEVVSSKPGDCAADFGATVQLADLQEMHNQFREQLDSGLKMLADNQVKGVPNEPAAGARAVAGGTADPAPDAEVQLVSQEADAVKLEAQVRQGGSGN